MIPGDLETTWGRLAGPDAAVYDAIVERGHFLQTRATAALACAGRPRQVRHIVVRAAGQPIGAAQLLRLGPIGWIERGPVASERALPAVMTAIERAARRRGVLWLQVSPYLDEPAGSWLTARGYRPEPGFGGLHRQTGRLAVEASEEALLAGHARAKLRTEVRRAVRHGALTVSDDPDGPRLLARLAGRPASWARAVAELVDRGSSAIVVGRDAQGPVGAVLVVAHGGLATYLSGAAIGAPRPYGKLVLPLVAAIGWARRRGVPTFDLGGLPARGDRDPKRAAIARFKAMFAPEPIALIAPHRRWLWP
jgi:hypothetical protein